MSRFSLRDLFWLTLVVGMGCAWWLQSWHDAQIREAYRHRETQMLMTIQDAEKQIVGFNKEVRRLMYYQDEMAGALRDLGSTLTGTIENRKPAEAEPLTKFPETLYPSHPCPAFSLPMAA